MLSSSSLKSFEPPFLRGYGAALLSVAAGTLGLLIMQGLWGFSAPIAVLLIAVVASTWVGGPKAGWLAIALSLLAFNCLDLSSGISVALSPAELGRLVFLAIATSCVVYFSATERSAARSAQELLKLVLATLPVGVAVIDRAGDIILSNAAFKRIWGDCLITSGRQRWVQSIGYWHGSGNKIAPTEWASVRALKKGQSSFNELVDIESYKGQRRTIENSAAPIRDGAGSIIGAVIVNQDVTERVRAEGAVRISAHCLHHLSRRLLEVQEEERRRLSRELHDEFGQLMACIMLQLHAAKSLAGEAAKAGLEESLVLLNKAAAELRSLALELRPTMLESAGIDATLRWLAEQHRQRSGLKIQFTGRLNEVSGELAIAIFRIAQEALTNIVRHAEARRVWIELAQSEQQLELAIRDDGKGFDVSKTLEQTPERGNLGLLGIRERVEILGGTLQIDSEGGGGTRIRVLLPARPA